MSANGRHNADSALIAALAAGMTYADAAQAAGVSARTARRRMNEEPFRSQMAVARADLVERAVGRASDSVVDAVDTLRELMHSASSETARLGAARALLDFVGRRRGDPVADAIRGASTVSPSELTPIFSSILDAALRRIPEEEELAFLNEVSAIRPRRV
jgi:hypothetical protein